MNTMLNVEMSFGKELLAEFKRLERFLVKSLEQRTRIHHVERCLFDHVMRLGLVLLQEFVAASGDGDHGKVIVQSGRILKRMKR